ncbi:metallo-beta-lactamase family protein [Entamoeba histolytica HM-1:IMSS-B]|uniref:Metallo-beta-lactamase family protein n=6 Tax=Entamoeba histolytica TaxID=5759 RepID=C4M309_ENTH1|nr:hypothetical protein EHI_025220 [Entamoeba histolytica HM-1:IMSS]EMD47213.1 metallobeta-lactamase family protein [Entamoeba histolytica KU27]EMH72706.1 metallo-beta-lactamase family protein [Entamoeba histolytica HM-1:IMSS-B]EMS12070.1 metallo-beta-lactamase family protein [Entamoeba histolytica HM-3:IMSS]ENY64841.1 metallo-beta-lactamase family protein, putative [Entamoeba histolytica HM-1:IMSS-A]GAT95683.1 hypothetical protein CL6EHI_025220 [Entamoeba histolytica]|eukprot:XP_652931.1 hypothetical protein EHI_025220 [Entamoeba histolytica HM-1:IMSS]
MSHILFINTTNSQPIYAQPIASTLFYTNKGKDLFLIDCGEGIANQLIQMKVPIERIRGIIITSSQANRSSGIGGIVHIISFSTKGKITIVGPKGIKMLVDSLFEYCGEKSPEPINYIELNVTEITQLNICNIQFTVIPSVHNNSIPNYGIICQIKNRQLNQKTVVMFNGDIRNFSPLINHIQNNKIQIDMLVYDYIINQNTKIQRKCECPTPDIISNIVNGCICPSKFVIRCYSSKCVEKEINEIINHIQNETQIQTLVAYNGTNVTLF